MVLNYNLTLSNDTIAMYVSKISARTVHVFTKLPRVWISSTDAAAVAEKGIRFVHAASSSLYLVRILL
jgi:hypothetical protein